MVLMRATLFTCLLCLLVQPRSVYAQGIPFTINHRKSDYRGGTQSWDIRQDSKGVLYVANNDGLLEFDGYEWRSAAVSNKTILRSIAVGKDGRIFAGAQDEIGFFRPDAHGALQYQSFKSLLPKGSTAFEDIWNIETTGETTYFQAKDRIICLRGEMATVLPAQSEFSFMGQAFQRVFVHDMAGALGEMKGDKLLPLANLPKEAGPVTAVLPFRGDTVLLSTVRGGIFAYSHGNTAPWRTGFDAFLIKNRIYTAAALPQGRLALGTSQGGVLILDANRQLVTHLTKGNGLQNNNILSLFCDRQGNLWAGTDNGIDCILAQSPFSFLIPDGDLEGTAYTVIIAGYKAYFGTANGLYLSNWNRPAVLSGPAFELVENTQGQVWGLVEIEGKLLMGHHDGAFELNGNRAQHIPGYQGAWTFQALEGHAGYMIGGGYGGLYLFQQQNSNWRLLRRLEGLDESCRFVVQESRSIIWVAHPYRGIYRIQLSEDLQQAKVDYFTQADGLPSNNFNHVFRINNEIVFTTERGIHRFNAQTRRFEAHPVYAEFFSADARVSRLVEGPDGDVWFAAEGEVGVLDIDDAGIRKQVRKRSLPKLAGSLVGGFEFIYPYDAQHVIFGADRGFILYDRQRSQQDSFTAKVLLRKVQLMNPADSLALLAPLSGAQAATLRYDQNAFKFVYALPLFGETEYVKYSHRLEGLEESWSAWSTKNEKEYNNLRYGSYTFLVKALLPDGTETTAAAFRFELRPPWYASRAARVLYILLLLAGLTTLVVAPQRRFRRERKQLEIEHRMKEEAHLRREAASQEALAQLKNEKLHAEIIHKNQELASATLHLLQKSEILTKTGEQLQKVAKNSEEPETRKAIQGLIRLLEQDAQFDEEWQQFALHFDQVHSDFLKRLTAQHPSLTPKDQRLCAYLRMNLSSKEMAQLMNISVRGVEISRYRLRKKLQLDSEENLTEFLMRV